MFLKLNKNIIFYFTIIVLLLFFIITKKIQDEKDNIKVFNTLSINLLTSVHPSLSWNFESTESNIKIKPGEVTTIEYVVENLEKKTTTGIASFAFYPKKIGKYITKINCFCYDAQTLKSQEKTNFTLVLLVDPGVTKDNETKNIKEATIQFTFFDYNKNNQIE